MTILNFTGMDTTLMDLISQCQEIQVVEEDPGMNLCQEQEPGVKVQEQEEPTLVNLLPCTVARCRDLPVRRIQRYKL